MTMADVKPIPRTTKPPDDYIVRCPYCKTPGANIPVWGHCNLDEKGDVIHSTIDVETTQPNAYDCWSNIWMCADEGCSYEGCEGCFTNLATKEV